MTHLYPPFTEKKTPSFWEDSSMMKVEQCLWWTLLWANSQSLRSFRRKKPWISGHPSASLIYQSHRPFIFPEVSQVLQNIPRIGTLTVTWEVGLNPFTLIVGPSRKCYNLRDTDAVTFSIVSRPSLFSSSLLLSNLSPIVACPCLSVTHWLTRSLLFSGLDCCDTSCWKCQLKTLWRIIIDDILFAGVDIQDRVDLGDIWQLASANQVRQQLDDGFSSFSYISFR